MQMPKQVSCVQYRTRHAGVLKPRLFQEETRNMYPALPEMPNEKVQETGQFMYSTVAGQLPALQATAANQPSVIQLPAPIQQSFTSDAAIGLHYQMSSAFSP